MMTLFACDDESKFGSRIGLNSTTSGFPFPFADAASQVMPRTWRDIYNWGRLCLMRSPEFVDSNRKLFSYFATELTVKASDSDDQEIGPEEARAWKDTLDNVIGYRSELLPFSLAVAAFGSVIYTVQTKCQRMLVCPHPECGAVINMLQGAREQDIDFQFRASTNQFLFRCPHPKCPNRRTRVPAIVKDWHTQKAEDLSLKQWPPDEMLIDYYLWTESDDIYWRIPEYYKQAVRRGHLETLAEADLDVLDAIRQNKLFRFYRDRVFHAKEMSIAGVGLRGRGVPRSLLQGPQIWTMQVLRHQNQVLGMDYLLPLGFFSLDDTPRGGNFSSPQATTNPNQFAQDIERMISIHRQDPSRKFGLPYTVRYQLAGGEANQFAPVALLQEAKTDIYDAGGVPLEMYRGSLNIQVMPVAARLFESSHQTIPCLFNRFASFVSRRVAEELDKPAADVSHKKSTVVGDIQRNAIIMQGVQMGQIPRSQLYDDIDVPVDVARDRMVEETIEDAKAQKRIQEELEASDLLQFMRQPPQPGQAPEEAAQSGAVPAGPAPGSASPVATQGLSLEEMSATADQLAQQLIDPQLPQSEVNRQLEAIKAKSPELHTLVRGAMEKLRNQAASAGQQMVLSGQV